MTFTACTEEYLQHPQKLQPVLWRSQSIHQWVFYNLVLEQSSGVDNHRPPKQFSGHFLRRDDVQRGAFSKLQVIDDQKLHISYLHLVAWSTNSKVSFTRFYFSSHLYRFLLLKVTKFIKNDWLNRNKTTSQNKTRKRKCFSHGSKRFLNGKARLKVNHVIKMNANPAQSPSFTHGICPPK